MKLKPTLLSVAIFFSTITSHASVPTSFTHPSFGTVNRVMGAFIDKRNHDAFFLASVPASAACVGATGYGDPNLDYAWFWMDGKSKALKPVTDVWCDEGHAFWEFTRKLRAHNQAEGFKPSAASDECYSSKRKWCAGGDIETPVTDSALGAVWPWLVLPATLAVTVPIDIIYNAGAYSVAGIDYLIQSKFRFKLYQVAFHADDWALQLVEGFRSGDPSKRLKHKHFRYLIRALTD